MHANTCGPSDVEIVSRQKLYHTVASSDLPALAEQPVLIADGAREAGQHAH